MAQHFVPDKIVLDKNIPFGIVRDLIVDIPVNSRGKVELYNDDFIGLTMDIDDNSVYLERAPLLAVGSAAWEVSEI
jgi:hypothetical protein